MERYLGGPQEQIKPHMDMRRKETFRLSMERQPTFRATKVAKGRGWEQ